METCSNIVNHMSTTTAQTTKHFSSAIHASTLYDTWLLWNKTTTHQQKSQSHSTAVCTSNHHEKAIQSNCCNVHKFTHLIVYSLLYKYVNYSSLLLDNHCYSCRSATTLCVFNDTTIIHSTICNNNIVQIYNWHAMYSQSVPFPVCLLLVAVSVHAASRG